MNAVFFALVVIAFATAGWRELAWVPAADAQVGPMEALA